MTKQEILDIAVAGLASQNFERCAGSDGKCRYTMPSDGEVRHCAWGWVDLALDQSGARSLISLWKEKVGIAGTLDKDTMYFASDLQVAHDDVNGGQRSANMKESILNLAEAHGLVIPGCLTDARNTFDKKA